MPCLSRTLASLTNRALISSRLSCLQMGETPLIRSAHNGHCGTVRFLVERGADMNALDMVRHSAAQRRGPGWQQVGRGTAAGHAPWALVPVGTAKV